MGWFSFSRSWGPVKNHLQYDEQLARMTGRGMLVTDRPGAISALKRIGYYRLSAYTYPFREPPTDADSAAGRTRSEKFRHGSSLNEALHLYDFDRKLRVVLLQALQEIEVGFASRVAYTLGRNSGNAHLETEHLDPILCMRLNKDGETEHAAWVKRFEKLRKDALDEEYVKHHVKHYGGQIPIWVATGFMDFGSMIRLYSLVTLKDRKKIAFDLGFRGNGSDALLRSLKALNILRNNCAHSNRVWNRSTVDVPPKISAQVVPDLLAHLNDLGDDERLKIYLLAALTAFLQRAINPESEWAWGTFPTQAKKLGNIAGMNLENTMGFPKGWQDLPLWQK
jgi:abortive infection bacteriophage resistance protein